MSGADWVAVAVLLGAVAAVIGSAVLAQVVVERLRSRRQLDPEHHAQLMHELRRQP